MNLIKIINERKSDYSEREKIRILIDIASFSLDTKIKIFQSSDFLEFFEHLIKTVFNKKEHQIKLSKILMHLLDEPTCFPQSHILFEIILKHNPKFHLNHCTTEINNNMNLASRLLMFIKSYEKEKQLNIYKKTLKMFSSQCDINQLYFVDIQNKYRAKQEGNSKINLISFIFEVLGSPSLVMHILLNADKYNIDLVAHSCDELGNILWQDDNKKNEKYIKTMIKKLPLSFFAKTFSYSLKDKSRVTNVYTLFLYYLKPSLIDYFFQCRPEVISFYQNKLDLFYVIANPKSNLKIKKELLEKLITPTNQEISEVMFFNSLSYALKNQESDIDQKEFIGFCEKSLLIKKLMIKDEKTSNHILCDFHYFANPKNIKDKILPLNEAHIPNSLGFYPLHYLVSYNKHISINSILPTMIDLIKSFKEKNIDLNCQTKKGNTPLHMAFKLNAHPTLIKELLLSGAKTTIKNKYGKTPFDYSFKFNKLGEIEDLINSTHEKEEFEKLIVNEAVMSSKLIKKI